MTDLHDESAVDHCVTRSLYRKTVRPGFTLCLSLFLRRGPWNRQLRTGAQGRGEVSRTEREGTG